MRKILKRLTVGAAAMALLLPLVGVAQPGKWYLNPAVGYQYFDSDLDLEASVTGIIGIERQVTDRWGVELRYMQTSADDRYDRSSFDADVYQYGVDGIRYLTSGVIPGWKPYLAVGLGHTEINRDSQANKTVTQGNAGAGLRYEFDDRWSFRGDVRWLYTFDTEQDNALASLGISYAFGGSREPAVKDSDGDGVPDHLDRCPRTPRGVQVDEHGCPIDSDGDGVPDYRDRCPGTPAGAAVDEHGCPLVLTETRTIRLDIGFQINSAEIQPAFASEVEKVAVFLRRYPNVKAVIEGHTDSTGRADYNKQLSQRRADAVKAELVTRYNIDATRLTAVGYGQERPVADNSTAEGRTANRRVVAVIEAEVERLKQQQ